MPGPDDTPITPPEEGLLVDPAEVGLDPTKVEALRARARREVDEGLLPSCQLALARHGRLVLFETHGAAAPASRYVIFSATKGFVAGVVWQLVHEGALTWDTRAAELVPEFGTNGKDVVTIEQLLTHTSGFPMAPLNPARAATREGRLEQFGRWRLAWEPGTRFEYHPTAAHWVLGACVEAVTGRPLRDEVHDRLTVPLGLPTFRLGEPPEHQGDVNELVAVGQPPTPDEMEVALGLRIDLAELLGEVTVDNLLQFNRPEVRAIGFPGAGGIATAADLALYYQGLAADTDGRWGADVLAQGTEPINDLPDPLTGVPAHRSRGLMVAGDPPVAQLHGFGHGNSPRSYGHDGAGGQVAWIDPDSGISLGYLTNGLDAHVLREGRRIIGLSSRAASCLADDPAA